MILRLTASKCNHVEGYNSSSYNYGYDRNLYVSAFTHGTARVKERTLLDFDYTPLTSKITSGSVVSSEIGEYILKIYTQPVTGSIINVKDDSIHVIPISSSWSEGTGSHDGALSHSSDWHSSSYGSPWINGGGDYYTGSAVTYTFDRLYEDIALTLSSSWITSLTASTYKGLILKYSDTDESGSIDYSRVLYSRHSNETIRQPSIFVYIDDDVQDNSYNLKTGVSQSIFLYTYDYDNSFSNITASLVSCSLYAFAHSGSASSSLIGSYTASNYKTGIYSCSFLLTQSFSGSIYTKWTDSGGNTVNTSSISIHDISVRTNTYNSYYPYNLYPSTDLQGVYNYNDLQTIRVFFYRTISNFSRTGSLQELVVFPEVYYRVIDLESGYVLHDYSKYTRMSMDTTSNYFNFSFDLLPENRYYKFEYKIVENKRDKILDSDLQFRVEKNENI